MDKNYFEIARWIAGYLMRAEGTEGSTELEEWRKEGENEKLLRKIERDARHRIIQRRYDDFPCREGWNCMQAKYLKSSRNLWKRRLRYVAVLLPFMIGSALWWVIRQPGSPEGRIYSSPEISCNFPTLILADGRRVVLTDSVFNLPDSKSFEYIPEILGEDLMEYHTITTPAQCDYHFTLSDGTRVWLNAASSVQFPVAFAGHERIISVSGEVYLEVARDTSRPFYVQTVHDKMLVKVVGTAFNINAYPDEEFTVVTLCEGKVEVHWENAKYALKPDQQLCFNHHSGGAEIKRVNTNDYISWKDGRYIFKGQTLEEVAKILQRWYDIEIRFENTRDKATIYTGVILKEKSLASFISTLNRISDCHCRLEGRILYIE